MDCFFHREHFVTSLVFVLAQLSDAHWAWLEVGVRAVHVTSIGTHVCVMKVFLIVFVFVAARSVMVARAHT